MYLYVSGRPSQALFALITQTETPSSQVNSNAQSYFTGIYTNPDAKSVAVSATYTAATSTAGSTIVLTGSGSIKSDFLQMIGLPNIGFNVSSTAAWGQSLLRVALVLDNTRSMADSGKMTAPQSACKKPRHPALGARKEQRRRLHLRHTIRNRRQCRHFECQRKLASLGPLGSEELFELELQRRLLDDDGPVSGPWTWGHSVGSPSHSQWNGWVTDRDHSSDTTSTSLPSQTTPFIADQDQSCPAATIVPLTYSWTNVIANIDAISPGGATNQTVGLQWAWLCLLQQSPLNAPAESTAGSSYRHIIILFTDGLNTGDRRYGDFSSQSLQVDTRMKTLCDNIKATGATIYTVQIDTDGAGRSAVLTYCASGSSHFFMLTAASQICHRL